MIEFSFMFFWSWEQGLYKKQADLGEPSREFGISVDVGNKQNVKRRRFFFISDTCSGNLKYKLLHWSCHLQVKGEESCRSPSLWHTFLNLRRPETVTHNLQDLSAGCSGFEDKLISPHLLSTSALRFLHSNLSFRLCDCLHDYSGDATWTQAMDKATESFLASAPLNMWARERKRTAQSTWKGALPSMIFSQSILRMSTNTWTTADCLSVTGHYCSKRISQQLWLH